MIFSLILSTNAMLLPYMLLLMAQKLLVHSLQNFGGTGLSSVICKTGTTDARIHLANRCVLQLSRPLHVCPRWQWEQTNGF
jgi:hypothetical protein